MSKGKEQGSSEVFFCLGPAFLMASFMPVLLRSQKNRLKVGLDMVPEAGLEPARYF